MGLEELPSVCWRYHVLPHLALADIATLSLCSRRLHTELATHASLRPAWLRWGALLAPQPWQAMRYALQYLPPSAHARASGSSPAPNDDNDDNDNDDNGNGGEVPVPLQPVPPDGAPAQAAPAAAAVAPPDGGGGGQAMSVLSARFAEALLRAAYHGDVGMGRWVQRHAPSGYASPTVLELAGAASVQYGWLGFAQWLLGEFGAARLQQGPRSPLRLIGLACANGHLETAQWVCSVFGVGAAEVRAEEVSLLGLVCQGGHLAVAQWLHRAFGLGPDDVRSRQSLAFALAAQSGHLDVAQWLHTTFGLTRADACADSNYAFCCSCEAGHLAVVRWLHDTFVLTAADVRQDNNYALRWACQNGHGDVVRWLVPTFALGLADARAAAAFMLPTNPRNAAVWGWLLARFGPTLAWGAGP